VPVGARVVGGPGRRACRPGASPSDLGSIAVDHCLCDENAVEWIAVVQWKPRKLKDVSQFDRRGPVTENRQAFGNVLGRRKRKAELAETVLDDDFPRAGHRKKDLMFLAAQNPLRIRVELLRREQVPRASNGYRRAASLVDLKRVKNSLRQGAVKVVGDPTGADIHSHRTGACSLTQGGGGDDEDFGRTRWKGGGKRQFDLVVLRNDDVEPGGVHGANV